jgi:general secretion pathway protein G
MRRCKRNAFTLVEILIVVVILGVLSAVVVPQFAQVTDEATKAATRDQLSKIRNAMAVYQARNAMALPNITEGDGTWGELIGEYLRKTPMNRWVGTDNGRTIIFGTDADQGYQTAHGWIYDPFTGNLWAGSFDADDEPYPRQ